MQSRCFLVLTLLACSSLTGARDVVRAESGTGGLQFDVLFADYGADAKFLQAEVGYIGESDLLVALHLARKSRVDAETIAGWRRVGMSWDRITRRCHADASIYYIDIPAGVAAPPYARAYGHWRQQPKSDLALTDDEIREFVLVQALADHCKIPQADIVRRRTAGENPRAILKAPKRSEDTTPKVPARTAAGSKPGTDKPSRPAGSGKSPRP